MSSSSSTHSDSSSTSSASSSSTSSESLPEKEVRRRPRGRQPQSRGNNNRASGRPGPGQGRTRIKQERVEKDGREVLRTGPEAEPELRPDGGEDVEMATERDGQPEREDANNNTIREEPDNTAGGPEPITHLLHDCPRFSLTARNIFSRGFPSSTASWSVREFLHFSYITDIDLAMEGSWRNGNPPRGEDIDNGSRRNHHDNPSDSSYTNTTDGDSGPSQQRIAS